MLVDNTVKALHEVLPDADIEACAREQAQNVYDYLVTGNQ